MTREIDHKSPPEADLFWQKLKKRRIPIREDDSKNFANFALVNNPPEGFLNRLADSFQYLGKTKFNRLLGRLALTAKEIIGSDSYSALFFKPIGSNPWIYDRLFYRHVPAARSFFSVLPGMYRDAELLTKYVRRGSKVLIPDDFSIYGNQLYDLCTIFPVKNYDTHVLLIAATDYAIKHGTNFGAKMHIMEIIKPVSVSLKVEDTDFLKSLHDILGLEAPPLNPDNIFFFWSWHKRPDTLPVLLTDEVKKNPYPLIRHIETPYRHIPGTS